MCSVLHGAGDFLPCRKEAFVLHPLFIILLILLGTVAFTVIYPVRLFVQAGLEAPKGGEIYFELQFFSGLFKLKYKLEINILREPYLTVRLYHGEEAPRVLWRAGEKKARTKRMNLPLKEVWRHVRLRKLHVSGELGISDDAFWTVMFSGVLFAVLQSLLVYACAEKEPSALQVKVVPAFSTDCLRLNLEGIAGCPPIHIISAILIWHLKNRKGQKAVWRILSKTS